MRVLLAIHNVYTEFTSGAARSVRSMLEWLAADGHACRVLSSAWFEATSGADLRSHLTQLGIAPRHRTAAAGCRVADYTLANVSVTAIETQHHTPKELNREEARQFLVVFQEMLRQFRPDLVLTYGGHPVLIEALKAARARRATTVRTVRAYGYEDRAWFAHVDRVLTNSAYVTEHYRRSIGLRSTPLPSPIVWSEILGADDTRGFLTFVNPSLHKGVALFARLADMLGRARPDIPILIVQSATDAAALATIPGLELAQFPQIVVSSPIVDARDLYGLTKILLVPSLFEEPFGRVAAEAMINGIPAVVSDRGALPRRLAKAVSCCRCPRGRKLPAAAYQTPKRSGPGSRRSPVSGTTRRSISGSRTQRAKGRDSDMTRLICASAMRRSSLPLRRIPICSNSTHQSRGNSETNVRSLPAPVRGIDAQ